MRAVKVHRKKLGLDREAMRKGPKLLGDDWLGKAPKIESIIIVSMYEPRL